MLPLLKQIKIDKNDTLYWPGDNSEEIYFVMRGQTKLYTKEGYPFIKYSMGDMFGDSDTLLD